MKNAFSSKCTKMALFWPSGRELTGLLKLVKQITE